MLSGRRPTLGTGASSSAIAPPLFGGSYEGDEADFRILADCLFEDEEADREKLKKKLLSPKAFGVVEGLQKFPPSRAPATGNFSVVEKGKIDLEDDDDDDDDDDFGADDFEGDDFDDDAEGFDGFQVNGEGEDDAGDGSGRGSKKCRRKRLRERQDQVERRRERNRVLARKTRLRKKFFFESLQQQAAQLASENEMLKEIVKKKLDMTLGSQILADCPSESRHDLLARGISSATEDGRAVAGGHSAAINQSPTTASGAPQDGSVCPSSSHTATASSAAAALATSGTITTILEITDYGLIASIQAAQRSFVITDPSLPDNPIIFASKGFLDLCGYSLEEVLGRNCRFMQSPNADPAQVNQLREGIHKGEDVSACILNVRADGSEFYNQIFVAPLRDSNGNIANYVGVQLEIKRSNARNGLVQDEDLRGFDGFGMGIGTKGARIAKKRLDSSMATAGGALKQSGPVGRGDRLARRNSEKDLARRNSEKNLPNLSSRSSSTSNLEDTAREVGAEL